MSPNPRRRTYLIRRPEQIEALVSPLRQLIVDTLEYHGPCTIAALGHELGRPADSLYYHVRKLLHVGLLVERGHRKSGLKDESVYDVPANRMELRYLPGDHGIAARVLKAAKATARLAERDFRAGLGSGRAVTSGGRRNLWSARRMGWLSNADLEEVNRLLWRLDVLLEKPRSPRRNRLCALTWILAPLQPRTRAARKAPHGKI